MLYACRLVRIQRIALHRGLKLITWQNASSGIRTHALIRGLELESNALTSSAIDA